MSARELGIDKLRRVGDAARFRNALLNVKGQVEHDETGEYPSRNIPAIIENLDDLRRKGILSKEGFERKKKELLDKI